METLVSQNPSLRCLTSWVAGTFDDITALEIKLNETRYWKTLHLVCPSQCLTNKMLNWLIKLVLIFRGLQVPMMLILMIHMTRMDRITCVFSHRIVNYVTF